MWKFLAVLGATYQELALRNLGSRTGVRRMGKVRRGDMHSVNPGPLPPCPYALANRRLGVHYPDGVNDVHTSASKVDSRP